MAWTEIMAETRNWQQQTAYVEVALMFEGTVGTDYPPSDGALITAAPASLTWEDALYTPSASFQVPSVVTSQMISYSTKAHAKLRVIYRGSRKQTG